MKPRLKIKQHIFFLLIGENNNEFNKETMESCLSAMSFNETDNEVEAILRTLAGDTLYPLKVNR